MVEISHSLNLGPLPEELVPVARRQGEDPNMVCNYLEELRNIIFGNKKLVLIQCFDGFDLRILERGDCEEPHRTDNEFLIKFLRARFFNVENAYKLVHNFIAFWMFKPIIFVAVTTLP